MPGARAPFRGQAPPANIDSSLMERVAGRTAFSVGAREYGWVDVVLAAHLWGEYANLERSVLRQRWASELDKITKAESVTAREVSDALYAEAVCSGALGELGERLAAQAAIYDRVAGSKGGRRPPGCSQAAVASLLKRLPATVKKTGVAGLTPGATSKRAELLACLAIVFERHIDEIAAPAALDREIEAHALDWTRIDCEQVLFADEGAT